VQCSLCCSPSGLVSAFFSWCGGLWGSYNSCGQCQSLSKERGYSISFSGNQSHSEMYRQVEVDYVKVTSINPDSVLCTVLPRGRQSLEQLLGSTLHRTDSFASTTADRQSKGP